MFLNADIIFDNLPSDLEPHIAGEKVLELALRRPRLYEGGHEPFLANQCYLVHASHVPTNAPAQRGCVIVCIGDAARLEHYRKRCCVITVSDQADFYRTFNLIQGIFDLYDAWEVDLSHMAAADGDISRMLTRSEPIFRNPLYALSADFRMLGTSASASLLNADPAIRPSDGGSLRLEAFDQFLGLHDLSVDEREPLVISMLDQTTLNFNLYDADAFQGCVTVHYAQQPYRPSDKPLVAFLGGMLLRAIKQLADRAPDGPGSLRQALQNLVEERPLDALERDIVNRSNNGKRFVCMRLKLSNQLEQLPLGYVRNTLESAFAHSVVFDYHRNSVVAIISIDDLEPGHQSAIQKAIAPFTDTMEMKAGVSLPFTDLNRARSLFLQANAALDLGILLDPSLKVYDFRDYALTHMVMNAIGDMPINLLIPEGLGRIVEHDAASSTSYLETLRLYLDNNMNVAKTAGQLFVHRSTLLERLARIKRELACDLDDPDTQLHLRLVLKAMQVRERLRKG